MGAVLAVSAGVLLPLTFLPLKECPHGHPFQLEAVKELKQGSTTVLVFRLTSLEGGRARLFTPGNISVPADTHHPVSGQWNQISPAKCVTNFVPITLETNVEFTIFAPTNEVWRLEVQTLQVPSRVSVLKWKVQAIWQELGSGNFSALREAWASGVATGDSTASRPFTTPVTTEQPHIQCDSSQAQAIRR